MFVVKNIKYVAFKTRKSIKYVAFSIKYVAFKAVFKHGKY